MNQSLYRDEIYLISLSGERSGPIRASVQGSKVYIKDEKAIVEEGGKIIRTLPNGREESYLILQADFHKSPIGHGLSHYSITTRKDSSLIKPFSSPTINISNSQGIQIGDGNTQHIVGSLQMMVQAIDSSNSSPEQKADAKAKLKEFLAHPVTSAILGSASAAIFGAL